LTRAFEAADGDRPDGQRLFATVPSARASIASFGSISIAPCCRAAPRSAPRAGATQLPAGPPERKLRKLCSAQRSDKRVGSGTAGHPPHAAPASAGSASLCRQLRGAALKVRFQPQCAPLPALSTKKRTGRTRSVGPPSCNSVRQWAAQGGYGVHQPRHGRRRGAPVTPSTPLCDH
jgi:hypothetical protein